MSDWFQLPCLLIFSFSFHATHQSSLWIRFSHVEQLPSLAGILVSLAPSQSRHDTSVVLEADDGFWPVLATTLLYQLDLES